MFSVWSVLFFEWFYGCCRCCFVLDNVILCENGLCVCFVHVSKWQHDATEWFCSCVYLITQLMLFCVNLFFMVVGCCCRCCFVVVRCARMLVFCLFFYDATECFWPHIYLITISTGKDFACCSHANFSHANARFSHAVHMRSTNVLMRNVTHHM